MTVNYDWPAYGKTYTAPTREEYLNEKPYYWTDVEELEAQIRTDSSEWDVDAVKKLCYITDNESLWEEADLEDITDVLEALGYKIY